MKHDPSRGRGEAPSIRPLPDRADLDCVVTILNRVADEGSYTAFEPEDRHRLMHSAMMQIVEAFGYLGDDLRREAHEALRFASRNARVAALLDAAGGEFRVGRRGPRDVYDGDEPLFMAATAEQAARLAALLNAGRRALAQHAGGSADG